MARTTATASISFGMVTIPFKMSKASSSGSPSVESMCECGSTDQGYAGTDTGDKVACKKCDRTYSWWNSLPKTGYELDSGETIELDTDEVDEAKSSSSVETGQVEKVSEVKTVLLHYNVEENYYLTPEDDFEDQYGVLVRVLDSKDVAMLTYLQLRNKTKRYAIISEGGVLMALELQDKKPLGEDIEYDVDEQMEQQAEMMMDQMKDDDPTLDDVQGQPLLGLIEEKKDDADDTSATEEEVAAQL